MIASSISHWHVIKKSNNNLKLIILIKPIGEQDWKDEARRYSLGNGLRRYTTRFTAKKQIA